MAYQVEISPAAQRQYKKLPKAIQPLILEMLARLAEDPRPEGVKKMEGSTDQYRVRLKDYRIIYQVQDKRLLVLVLKIGHRRDIYRIS